MGAVKKMTNQNNELHNIFCQTIKKFHIESLEFLAKNMLFISIEMAMITGTAIKISWKDNDGKKIIIRSDCEIYEYSQEDIDNINNC